ncbi:FAD-dependent thymidylate synthase [candidate division WOR-3 bacterium]|nr:FAD-dependent thymidylate synthase [candidate division WOR-3 bacterium]
MKLQVTLAGHNVDVAALRECKDGTKSVLLTPESISAAYARISRSPKTVGELREDARHETARARASNQRIIFEMGHHSVAEHAVFNFDITGVSRRAIEEFERFRLCSYTEKSQRYVTLKGDYLVPDELRDGVLRREFRKVVRLQNEMYQTLYEEICAYNLSRHPGRARRREDRRLLENAAKEDARYILSLATQTQVGATINARNLELMVRRFAAHHLAEVRELGRQLHDRARRIAPSILLFCRPNDYDARTYGELAGRFRRTAGPHGANAADYVTLVDHTPDGDDRILATLLLRVSGHEYSVCRRAVRRMSKRNKVELFKKACAHLELYDVVLREFEYADLCYSVVVSAGCFGQLKRHRMASIVWSDYDPDLGVTVPESVDAVGEKEQFLEIIGQTDRLYRKIEKRLPGIGTYILTNAHRRRVLVKINLRELYHMSRLREDPTAQWDIRNIVRQMSALAKDVMPVTTMLLGGKSDYPAVYRSVFGHYPKVRTVPLP